MTSTTKLALFAGASAFTMASFGATTAPEAKTLIFSIIGTPKHVLNAGVLGAWRKDVLKETNGRINFKIPPNPLAPPPRLYDATKSGVTDGAVQFNAFLQRRVPSVQISLLPLLFTRADAHAVALQRTYDRYFAKKGEYKGVKLIGFQSGVGGVMCSLKDTPITSVKNIRTLKMWSLPGFAAKAMAKLKVNVTPGPAVRIYPIVSKGVVDGFNGLTPGDAYAFNVVQYTKSCTQVPGGSFTPTFSMLLNPKVWDGLSKADQEGIMRASGERGAMHSRIWQENGVQGDKRFTADGKKLIKASPEFAAALKKAWKPLHNEWIQIANKAGIDGQGAFDFFRSESKKLAAKFSK